MFRERFDVQAPWPIAQQNITGDMDGHSKGGVRFAEAFLRMHCAFLS